MYADLVRFRSSDADHGLLLREKQEVDAVSLRFGSYYRDS